MRVKLVYFNQKWNIYLYTEGGYNTWINNFTTNTIISEEKGGEYRLRTYNHPIIPIYSFGFMYNDAHAKQRPGHQGEWSSNARHINTIYNTQLTEIGVDQMSVAVPIPWLQRLFGSMVTWETDEYGTHIQYVKGAHNTYDAVIELELDKSQEVTV